MCEWVCSAKCPAIAPECNGTPLGIKLWIEDFVKSHIPTLQTAPRTTLESEFDNWQEPGLYM